MRQLATTIIFSFIIISSQAQGIQFFEGTWQEALDKAKKEEKLLFVDAFAQWCGPCKNMAKNVFTLPEVGEFFNKNFINLKLDMESPDGRAFGDKYPVSAYPTLLFIDNKGKVVKKVVGGQKPDGLIEQGKDALKKNDTSTDLEKEYSEGKRDFDFMIKYVKALNNAGKPSQKIANDYLQSNPEISADQKLTFMFEAATEADSKMFEEVLKNKDQIIKLMGKGAFEDKTKTVCKATINKAIEFETKELMDEALSKAKQVLTVDYDQFQYTSMMYYYNSFQQKEEYLKAAESLAKKVGKKDEKTMKFIIEDFCKNYKNDPKVMNKASNFAEQLYDTNKSNENLILYCKTMVENNEVDKALRLAEDVLADMKKKEGQDTHQIEGLINFLKSKKG